MTYGIVMPIVAMIVGLILVILLAKTSYRRGYEDGLKVNQRRVALGRLRRILGDAVVRQEIKGLVRILGERAA